MDLNDPLNRAHRSQRAAKRSLSSGDVSEAVQHLFNAVENFHDAETAYRSAAGGISSDYVIKSLIAQRQECQALVEKLSVKLTHLHHQWRDLMEKKKHHSKLTLSTLDYEHDDAALADVKLLDYRQLKQKVVEKIDKQDTLIAWLQESSADGDQQPTEAAVARKPDKVIIEELRAVNGLLRALVDRLVKDLDAKQELIKTLQQELDIARATPFEVKNDNDGSKSPELPPLDFPQFAPAPSTESE